MSGKRGAPKGNRSAWKHGFYSRAYTRVEGREISRIIQDHRQNNIEFFKIVIARVAERIKPTASHPLTFCETLDALQTVVLAVNRLHGAVNLKYRLYWDSRNENQENGLELLAYSMDDEGEEGEIKRDAIAFLQRMGIAHGGQPGNDNAVKHGFFATHFRPEELGRLEDVTQDDLTEEIVLLQVLMKRVFIGMQEKISLSDYFRSVRALSRADACLARLRRVMIKLTGCSYLMQKAYDELKRIPFEED